MLSLSLQRMRLTTLGAMLLLSISVLVPSAHAFHDLFNPASYELNLAFGGIHQVATVQYNGEPGVAGETGEVLPFDCDRVKGSLQCSTESPESKIAIISPTLRSRVTFGNLFNHSLQTRLYPVYTRNQFKRDTEDPLTPPVRSSDIRVYGLGTAGMYDLAIRTPEWTPDLIFGIGATAHAVSADITLNTVRNKVLAMPIGLALEFEVVWLRRSSGSIRSGWYAGFASSQLHLKQKVPGVKAKSLVLNRTGIDIIQWSMPLNEIMLASSRLWNRYMAKQ